ncbi:sulfatase 1b, partial [Plakobranchus ocellatus]
MDVRSCCVIAAVTILVSCTLCVNTVETDQKIPPHIVFIVADDLGWNDVGWHNPEILTPNLNSLAARGVKLESSYVLPTCTPSRNSFMTGRFAFHTELQRALDPSEPNFLPLKYPTIAEKLKHQGYATHMVGKWHLGYCDEKYTPVRRGFDSFLGFYMGSQGYFNHQRTVTVEETVSSSAMFSSFGHVLMSSFMNVRATGSATGHDFRFNTSIWLKADGQYSTHVFAERAIEVIKRHDRSVPLFLYLPFQAPHSPLEVPKKYELLYSHIDSRIRRVFSGMVSALDEAVGRISDALHETGLMENLLLVFTSDNGGYPFMGGNNMPLRGSKNTNWEGGTRVPTFVYSPTLLQRKGYTSNGLFHAVDWFPTFLDVAGAPP